MEFGSLPLAIVASEATLEIQYDTPGETGG
jgi:hypothetical protein